MAVKRKSPRRQPRKKNPDTNGEGGGGLIPWLVGLGAAGLVGFGAYKMLGGGAQAPQQAMNGMAGGPDPWQQQQAAALQQQVGPGGVMGFDQAEGRLPVIALPQESARRTTQAQRFRYNLAGGAALPMTQQQAAAHGISPFQQAPPGTVYSPHGPPQGAIPVESFGGSEGRGNLGGENF